MSLRLVRAQMNTGTDGAQAALDMFDGMTKQGSVQAARMLAEQHEEDAFHLEQDAFRLEQVPSQWSEAIRHAQTSI